jgi:hypothetical protein
VACGRHIQEAEAGTASTAEGMPEETDDDVEVAVVATVTDMAA